MKLILLYIAYRMIMEEHIIYKILSFGLGNAILAIMRIIRNALAIQN